MPLEHNKQLKSNFNSAIYFYVDPMLLFSKIF